MSDQKVLLKLHRRYSKDEAVAELFAEIKRLNFRIGELTSENAELKYKLENPDGVERKTAKEWSKDELVADLKGRITTLETSKRKAEKDMEKWRDKYIALANQSTTITK